MAKQTRTTPAKLAALNTKAPAAAVVTKEPSAFDVALSAKLDATQSAVAHGMAGKLADQANAGLDFIRELRGAADKWGDDKALAIGLAAMREVYAAKGLEVTRARYAELKAVVTMPRPQFDAIFNDGRWSAVSSFGLTGRANYNEKGERTGKVELTPAQKAEAKAKREADKLAAARKLLANPGVPADTGEHPHTAKASTAMASAMTILAAIKTDDLPADVAELLAEAVATLGFAKVKANKAGK